MKKILAILLLLAILAGCTVVPVESKPASSTQPVSSTEPVETVPSAPAASDPLTVIRGWLSQDHTFEHTSKHGTLGGSYTTEHVQTFAKDGSYSFFSQWITANTAADSKTVETAQYYYQYEDDAMVCYMRIDGGAPQRFVVPDSEVENMAAQRSYFSGINEVLPVYLKDFTEDTEHIDPLTRRFTYKLSLPLVLQTESMLCRFVLDGYIFRGKQNDPTLDVDLLCSLTVDAKTLQPISFVCDFAQLKVHLLSSGDISMESALLTDLMPFSYTYSFELPNSILVPEDFIPQ